MKVILTYGTFDLFHIGHVRVLQRIRSLGDRLIVGCSTDEFNLSKGKKSLFNYQDRAEILSSCKFVDEVFPEHNWEQKKDDILKYKADVFAIGDDWVGEFDDLIPFADVIYMPRTQGISTTEIKQIVSAINDEKLQELKNSVNHLQGIVNRF